MTQKAVFLSPHPIFRKDMENHSGKEPVQYPEGHIAVSMGNREAHILSGRVGLYTSGPEIVSAVERELHTSLHEVERVVIFINGKSLDIIGPMIRHLPAEKMIWLACRCAQSAGVDKIIREHLKAKYNGESERMRVGIIPARHCVVSDQMPVMIQGWLMHGKVPIAMS